MKKLLLLLIVLLGLTLSTNAETYTYDFSSNKNWVTAKGGSQNVGTGSSSKLNTFYSKETGDAFNAGGKGYFNSGYFLWGRSGAYIELPTFEGEKITNVTAKSSTGCSTSVMVGIYSGSTNVVAAKQWSTKDKEYSYDIPEAYQESVLRLQITSSHNSQIVKLIITTEVEGATPTLAAPTFSQEDGYVFTTPFDLTISSDEADATIYYTLDGSDPTAESDIYSAPITISETTTIKAYAAKEGFNDSPITTATYTYVDPNDMKRYGLITSTDQLVEGIDYLIAYKTYAMGAISGSFFSKVDIDAASNDVISISTEAVNPVTLGGEEGAWTFKTAMEDNYLYWGSNGGAGGNNMTVYDNGSGMYWEISIADGVAIITNNHTTATESKERYLQYNSSDPRFACYINTQQNPSLYAALQYIYISDQTTNGDVRILSFVSKDDSSKAITFYNAEEGTWNSEDVMTLIQSVTYNKRFGFIPATGDYLITYVYTDKSGNEVEKTYEFAPQNDGYISFSDETITGIDGIEAENAPVEYFNLQGVRIANPENGLFIRRQGNKVEKIMLK